MTIRPVDRFVGAMHRENAEELMLETVEAVENGNGAHGTGTSPTVRDLVLGIAAKVSRIDREFDAMRDDRDADRMLLQQISQDVRDHAAAMRRVGDIWAKIYQRKFAVEDKMP